MGRNSHGTLQNAGVTCWFPHLGRPPYKSEVKGVLYETEGEACDLFSEMHHLFLIPPTPIGGRIQRGTPSAVFALQLG